MNGVICKMKYASVNIKLAGKTYKNPLKLGNLRVILARNHSKILPEIAENLTLRAGLVETRTGQHPSNVFLSVSWDHKP